MESFLQSKTYLKALFKHDLNYVEVGRCLMQAKCNAEGPRELSASVFFFYPALRSHLS